MADPVDTLALLTASAIIFIGVLISIGLNPWAVTSFISQLGGWLREDLTDWFHRSIKRVAEWARRGFR